MGRILHFFKLFHTLLVVSIQKSILYKMKNINMKKFELNAKKKIYTHTRIYIYLEEKKGS